MAGRTGVTAALMTQCGAPAADDARVTIIIAPDERAGLRRAASAKAIPCQSLTARLTAAGRTHRRPATTNQTVNSGANAPRTGGRPPHSRRRRRNSGGGGRRTPRAGGGGGASPK